MGEKKDGKKIENIYCVKCRKEVPIEDPETVTMKSDRVALNGKCPYCGITAYKIISGV